MPIWGLGRGRAELIVSLGQKTISTSVSFIYYWKVKNFLGEGQARFSLVFLFQIDANPLSS